MSAPKILLLSRASCRARLPELKDFLSLVQIEFALAHNPEDADEAKKLVEQVACFNKPVAIVADFPADLAINEDGSIKPIFFCDEEPAPVSNLILCE